MKHHIAALGFFPAIIIKSKKYEAVFFFFPMCSGFKAHASVQKTVKIPSENSIWMKMKWNEKHSSREENALANVVTKP